VSRAARVFVKVLMFKAVGMRDMVEGGEWKVEVALANCGTEMG